MCEQSIVNYTLVEGSGKMLSGYNEINWNGKVEKLFRNGCRSHDFIWGVIRSGMTDILLEDREYIDDPEIAYELINISPKFYTTFTRSVKLDDNILDEVIFTEMNTLIPCFGKKNLDHKITCSLIIGQMNKKNKTPRGLLFKMLRAFPELFSELDISFRNDRELTLLVIRRSSDPGIMKYVHPNLKNDKKIFTVAGKRMGYDEIIMYAGDKLLEDKKFCVDVVLNSPLCYKYLGNRKYDPKVLKMSLKRRFIQDFPEDLKMGKNLARMCANRGIPVWKYTDKTNLDHAIRAMIGNPRNYQFLGAPFTKNKLVLNLALCDCVYNYYPLKHNGFRIGENTFLDYTDMIYEIYECSYDDLPGDLISMRNIITNDPRYRNNYKILQRLQFIITPLYFKKKDPKHHLDLWCKLWDGNGLRMYNPPGDMLIKYVCF